MATINVITDGGGDYTNLYDALVANTAPTESLLFLLSGTANDTSLNNVEINTIFNPNGQNVVIQGDVSNSIALWDNTKATIEITSARCRNRTITTLEFRDLQWDITYIGSSGEYGFYGSNTSRTTFHNVHFRTINNFAGVAVMSATNDGLIMDRCFFHGLSATASGTAIALYGGIYGNINLSQVTIYNYAIGIGCPNGAVTTNQVEVIDTAIAECTTSIHADVPSSEVTYSALPIAYGTGNIVVTTWNTVFTNAANGDLTLLPTDTQLTGAGSTGNNIGWYQGGPGTYYLRADGTATSKAEASDPASAATSMSITTANSQVFIPGDELQFSDAGGVFQDIFIVPNSGEDGNVILISKVSGQTPVISGSDNEGTPSYDRASCIQIINQDYITIQDLECRYAGGVGATDGEAIIVSGTSSNIILQNNTLHNNKNAGLRLSDTASVTNTTNVLHDNGITDISLQDTSVLTATGDELYNSPKCIDIIDSATATIATGNLHDFSGTSGIEADGTGSPVLSVTGSTIDGVSGSSNGINMARGTLGAITGNTISNVQSGLIIGFDTLQASVTISGNTFEETSVYGIDCYRGTNNILDNIFKNSRIFAIHNRSNSVLYAYRNLFTDNLSNYGNGMYLTGEFYCRYNIFNGALSLGCQLYGSINPNSILGNNYFNGSGGSAIDAANLSVKIENCAARGSVNANFLNIGISIGAERVKNCISSKADFPVPVSDGNVNSVDDTAWLTYFISFTTTDLDYALPVTDGGADGTGITIDDAGGTYFNDEEVSSTVWDIGAKGLQYVFTITYVAGTNGTITGTLIQSIQEGEDTEAVIAVPDGGYILDQWSDGWSLEARQDKDIIADATYTANFTLPPTTVTITYVAGTNGSITGDLTQIINYGEDGTAVTAVPDNPVTHEFLGWSPENISYDSATRTDVDCTEDLTVTAIFGAINRITGGTYTYGNGGDFDGIVHAVKNVRELTANLFLVRVGTGEDLIYTRARMIDDLVLNGFYIDINGSGGVFKGESIRQQIYIRQLNNIGVTSGAPNQVFLHDFKIISSQNTGNFAIIGTYPGSHAVITIYNMRMYVTNTVNENYPHYVNGGPKSGEPDPNTASLILNYYNNAIIWTSPYKSNPYEIFGTDPYTTTNLTINPSNILIYSDGSFSDFRSSPNTCDGEVRNIASLGLRIADFSDESFTVISNVITSDDTGTIINQEPTDLYESFDPDDSNFLKPVFGSVADIGGSDPTAVSTEDMNGTTWTEPYSIGPVQRERTSLEISSIPSQQIMGTLEINSIVNLSGINSQQVMGTIVHSSTVNISGFDSQQVMGTIQLVSLLNLSGIDSQQVMSAAIVSSLIEISGIDSQQIMSIAEANSSLTLDLPGIDSQQVMGALTLDDTLTLSIPGIDSQQVMGAAELIRAGVMEAAGIDSQQVMGTISLSSSFEITGIDSQQVMSGAVLSVSRLEITGIDSQQVMSGVILYTSNYLLVDPIDSQQIMSGATLTSVPCSLKDSMVGIFTHMASVITRFTLQYLTGLYGYKTRVWFPNDGTYDPGTEHEPNTRSGSIYNREASEYRYDTNPNLPCEVILYTNIMDFERIESSTIVDNFEIDELYAFTSNVQIVANSLLLVSYAGKEFSVKVERVKVLESNYDANGEAVRRLDLIPYT